MTYDMVAVYAGLVCMTVAFVQHVARVNRSFRLRAEEAEARAGLEEAMRQVRQRRPEPPGSVLRVSKGHEGYGQVIQTVRINASQVPPYRPAPSPTARCQWCRVKLTNGECVDGCGGHQ